MNKNNWVWNVLVAISILLGTLFFGTYKKTLSANLGGIQNNYAVADYICKSLDFILSEKDHCLKEWIEYEDEYNGK